MIGYHYSPSRNAESILKHGLLVPLKHPKLTMPVTCSEGHRNPHISLADNPADAWLLSGGFLYSRAIEQGVHRGWISGNLKGISPFWSLFQVDLDGIRYRRFGMELQSRVDIPRAKVHYVGARAINT